MQTIFLNVKDSGRCALIEKDPLAGRVLVEVASGARIWVALSECELAGAELELEAPAVADRVQCLLCARHLTCREDDGEGAPSEEVGRCTLNEQFRALHFERICSDFIPLPVDPLRAEGVAP